MARERNDQRTADACMRAASRKGRIDDESRRRLGQSLRLFYAGLLEQPLPERFTRLLDDLSAEPTVKASSRTPVMPHDTDTSREGSS